MGLISSQFEFESNLLLTSNRDNPEENDSRPREEMRESLLAARFRASEILSGRALCALLVLGKALFHLTPRVGRARSRPPCRKHRQRLPGGFHGCGSVA